jgi:hypothetical protein
MAQTLLFPLLNRPLLYGSMGASSSIKMDTDGDMIAYKYMPSVTSPITDIDMNLDETGDTSGIDFAIEVRPDDGDKPHASTVLGAVTSNFAFTADGFTGLKTLGTNTGNLTVNVPVWLVLKRTGGSSLSGSNYVSARGQFGGGTVPSAHRCRAYNGADWTTITGANGNCNFVVLHENGEYYGNPVSSAAATPASAPDIFDDNKAGMKFRVGCKATLIGFAANITKTGTPTDLKVRLFEGTTEKTSVVIPAASVVSGGFEYYFTSAVELAADADCYIVLNQVGTDETDGGDGSNDYRLNVYQFTATYAGLMRPANWAFVYGTSTTPTSLTVQAGEFPVMSLLLASPETSLDCAAGGSGGSYAFIG